MHCCEIDASTCCSQISFKGNQRQLLAHTIPITNTDCFSALHSSPTVCLKLIHWLYEGLDCPNTNLIVFLSMQTEAICNKPMMFLNTTAWHSESSALKTWELFMVQPDPLMLFLLHTPFSFIFIFSTNNQFFTFSDFTYPFRYSTQNPNINLSHC